MLRQAEERMTADSSCEYDASVPSIVTVGNSGAESKEREMLGSWVLRYVNVPPQEAGHICVDATDKTVCTSMYDYFKDQITRIWEENKLHATGAVLAEFLWILLMILVPFDGYKLTHVDLILLNIACLSTFFALSRKSQIIFSAFVCCVLNGINDHFMHSLSNKNGVMIIPIPAWRVFAIIGYDVFAIAIGLIRRLSRSN
ncbi:Hypothetical predicted protein [Cloeon dipterum]|uniref:Uncharacterized protein n=1 Tax=Cloeon dipterum TaxID=197152 RepID=A0A8S1D989_9INSE|nr:Hypothetical predicted protein [Cloeon dipterum]